ncbi:hypothetical protein HHK36_020715 [Tetracentron sinense]|uniref:MSP domain-containing protein n=1 Tax=Tetracentron sinense TaxID=13715 RepID=A0A834YUI1_TETSI|nr:hypothetical protein HHK36_020715 [Tetracentron sinense]
MQETPYPVSPKPGRDVKTTSPKKYCVRPNIGIIKPKSTSDFTVTMQAQRLAPPDMQCKDKFLIQSTIVLSGTTAEEITPSMFSKDNGTYIEENKLKVVLISPPHSPVLLPLNGSLKQGLAYEVSIPKDQVLNGGENLPPPSKFAKDVEELKTSKDGDELRPAKAVEELKLAKDTEELELAKDTKELELVKDTEELELAKDVEELKSKLNELESKLSEAELTITKLREERSTTIQERETLQQELVSSFEKDEWCKKSSGGIPLSVCLYGCAHQCSTGIPATPLRKKAHSGGITSDNS